MKDKPLIAVLALAAMMTGTMQAEVKYDDGIRHKVELQIDGGMALGLNESDLAGLADLGLGWNATSHWYVGVASGAYVKYGVVYGGDPSWALPLLGQLTFRWNIDDENWSPLIDLRGGMLKSMKGDGKLVDGSDYHYGNYYIGELNVGMDLRLKRNIDLRLKFGYAYAKAKADGFDPTRCPDMHSLQLKVGISLRPKPHSGTRLEVMRQNNIERSHQQMAEERERAEQRRQEELQAEEHARQLREERRLQRQGSVDALSNAASAVSTNTAAASNVASVSSASSAVSTNAAAASASSTGSVASPVPSDTLQTLHVGNSGAKLLPPDARRLTRVTPRMMEANYYSDTLSDLGLKVSNRQVKEVFIVGPEDKAAEVKKLMRNQYFVDDSIVRILGGETGDSKAVVVLYVR